MFVFFKISSSCILIPVQVSKRDSRQWRGRGVPCSSLRTLPAPVIPFLKPRWGGWKGQFLSQKIPPALGEAAGPSPSLVVVWYLQLDRVADRGRKGVRCAVKSYSVWACAQGGWLAAQRLWKEGNHNLWMVTLHRITSISFKYIYVCMYWNVNKKWCFVPS